MKKNIIEFFKRGFIACGFGPLVLAVIYLILQRSFSLETLTVSEVCTGIFSLTALAFLAGGMNIVYQIEKLPLMTAILIHGGVLYATYLCTYLLNDWIVWRKTPILIFSVFFIIGYAAIWAVIYFTTRKKTQQLNEILKQRQEIESK